MEFGVATATLTKKLSNGYGVSGKSPYEGVFTTPVKFRAHGLSSRFEDYCEIFGGSEATLGSSIPIIEVPESNERKKLDDIRRSKLEYSKVFGGFRNLDTAVPYEELLAEPKRKNSFPKEARRPAEVGNQSSNKDPTICSKETPLVSQKAFSFDGPKSINMSYHKINQGSENRTSGTTYVTQLHAVPAYTCLIEEVNPLKMNRADKSIPVAQDAYSSSHCKEGIKEGRHCTESVAGPSSPDSDKKQSSNGRVKVQKRSDSIHLVFDAREISHGSNGANYIKVHSSDNHNSDAVRSVATKSQVFISDASERTAGDDSPTFLDELVDSNSEAAASVAALRKAIEEAQERINVAKESMKRRKEGFPDCVKWRFNNDLKAEGKTEVRYTHKAMTLEETNIWQTFAKTDALQQTKSEIGKPMMRVEQVIPDLSVKDVRETQKTSKTTQEAHEEEADWKEADHEARVLGFQEAGYDQNVLYTEGVFQWNEKSTGTDAFEMPKESGQSMEVVEGAWEQETNEEKTRAGSEGGGNEEFVDETKLAHETLDCGAEDTRLKVDEETESKMYEAVGHKELVDEKQNCERKLGEQGITIKNEKEFACKLEDGEKKVEVYCELEKCQRNLRAHQEPVEVEMNVSQKQQESEEKVKVFGKLKECELRAFLEPIDNEKVFSSHSLHLKSMEKQIDNSGCVDDVKERNEDGFPGTNKEVEHFCQREGTENRFGDTCMQRILEEIVDHIHDEEEIQERITEDSESDTIKRLQIAKENKKEPDGATYLLEENERGRKYDSECVEVMGVTLTGPNYEEKETQEVGKTTEISPSYEPYETMSMSKMQAADTSVENDETLKVTPAGYAHNEQDNIMVASIALFQYEEKYKEPKSVQESNDFEEKHIVETSGLTQEALELNDTADKMKNTNEAVTFDCAATNISETGIKTEKNQDQCLKEAENDCNLARFIEERNAESIEISSDAKEAEVVLNQEIDHNQCDSSDEEQLVNNENDTEASQLPTMSERKSSPLNDQGISTSHSNLKDNHRATLMMEGKKANGISLKVELEKENLRNIDEAKEREREKEKLAVERAICEARERAFAEAQERAAVERAAAEACRKNISDGRERLGKTTGGQAYEKTTAEKAAKEAKLKAERAAVERATAEARARALERALSEKAAFEARNKSDKFVAENSFGTSRDNGMRPNFYSKSFSHDAFDSTYGETAQRCKARSEKHQRIGERVAKAIAEKNMRDQLVQKEQEERNRLAEALDADVKRWSSGKEGNLRALLSTLQYILGPDSGWQPIPMTDIVITTAVKKAYRKATLYVHPDKLQQRGASIQQKYTCEKVFDLLKDAWNRFNMQER